MAYGVAGQNGNFQLTFNTNASNGYFFKSSLNLSNATSILTNDFNSLYTLTSPADPITYTVIYNTGTERIGVSCPGISRNDTHTFYTPSVYETTVTSAAALSSANQLRYYPQVIAQNTVVDSLGETAISSSGYGMYTLSDFGTISIDDEYKTYYIHPDSQGNRLRTATATSPPSYVPSGFATSGYPDPGTYNFSGVQNITFDQPFAAPPLIFITQTEVPVSLHQFIKNANGQYIGASIVAPSILDTGSNVNGVYNPPSGYNFSGVSYRKPQSGSFTYFIVSPEEPVNTNVASVGVRLFNSNSEKIFDSSYFTTSFFSINIPIPKAYWYVDSSQGYYQDEDVGGTVTQNLGLCINNINAFVGASRYISYTLTINGSLAGSIGPFNFLGRYLYMQPSTTEAYINDWFVIGTGSCSILPKINITASRSYFRSWDFHIGNWNIAGGETPTMDLVAAYHNLSI